MPTRLEAALGASGRIRNMLRAYLNRSHGEIHSHLGSSVSNVMIYVGVMVMLLAHLEAWGEIDTQYSLALVVWAALSGKDEGDSACNYLCSRTIGGRLKGVQLLFSEYRGEFVPILNALNELEYTPTRLNAVSGASRGIRNMLRASLNGSPRGTYSGPGLLMWNTEDEYTKVVKMILDHQGKGDSSNQVPIPLPAQDEQVLVAQLKSPESTEKSLEPTRLFSNWRLAIFVLLYWVWAFA